MRSSRSEEHTSELQSLAYLVCRLLLEKKKPASMRSSPERPARVNPRCSTSSSPTSRCGAARTRSSFTSWISRSAFFFNDTPPTEIYTLSLHDALPIFPNRPVVYVLGKSTSGRPAIQTVRPLVDRSEEHTSELQSLAYLVCRLLLE